MTKNYQRALFLAASLLCFCVVFVNIFFLSEVDLSLRLGIATVFGLWGLDLMLRGIFFPPTPLPPEKKNTRLRGLTRNFSTKGKS